MRFRDRNGRFCRKSRRTNLDLKGKVFGYLKVVRFAGFVGCRRLWKCVCRCAKFVFVHTNALTTGNTTSCGCRKDEVATGNLPKGKHGHAKPGKVSPTWVSWFSMKQRCYYTKGRSYPRYGGSGVKICPQWLGENGFAQFLKDLGPRPSGTTLGRFKDMGNYTPSNCRWMTRSEQQTERLKKMEEA